MKKKAIIVGIDGGTFTLIDKFIEEGALPFFKYLKETGSFGKMKSVDQNTRVPISPTIWTSLATGKRAEKHNIKSFFNLQQDIRSARFFEILNHYGYTVGNFGWELTWPPENYGSFNIPCNMARDNSTIPAKLSVVQEMRKRAKKGKTNIAQNISFFFRLKSAGVSLNTLTALSKNILFEKKDKKIKMFHRLIHGNRVNLDIFINAYKEHNPDIGFYFIPITDSGAHYYWKYFDKENFADISESERRMYGSYLKELYIETDNSLKKIFELNKDALFFVISDHGMRPIREGSFETISLKSRKFLEEAELYEKLEFYHVGLNNVVIPKEGTNIDSDGLFNFLKNIKIMPVNKGFFEVVERDNTGRIFIKVQQKDGDFYKGLNFDELTIQIGTKSVKFTDYIEINEFERSADHDEYGIFMIAGENVKKNNCIDDCEIYDFLPTLLDALNLPIAKDFDGSKIGAFIKDNKSEFIDSYDFLIKHSKTEIKADDEYIKEELRRLGYLKDK